MDGPTMDPIVGADSALNPFGIPDTAFAALENMGRELTCSICRSVFGKESAIVKLECCHYFCK